MRLRPLDFAAFVALAGCGTSPSRSADPPAGAPFTVSAVATFDSPWAMSFLPGTTTAIVTEKPGRLWLVDVANGRKQAVAGAPRVVASYQGGLLDVVVSPTFAQDHGVYLTYSEPSANGGSGLALARATLEAQHLEGLTLLWHDPEGGHGEQFGGIVAFAPDGRSLFLTTGDRQRFTPAQDPSEPLGKILHLTLDGKPAPGNPWAGKLGAPTVTITNPPEDTELAKHVSGHPFRWPGPDLTPEQTWSLGHRNPYGLAFASDGRLWETEMGPRGGDELNLIQPGRNYGWPLVSEGDNYDGVVIPHSSRPDIEAPKLYWVPSVSPTSLLIYSGGLFAKWQGDGLIGALSGQALIHVRIRGDQAAKLEQWDMGARIRFVGQGPEGAVYLLEDGPGGRLLRLTPRP